MGNFFNNGPKILKSIVRVRIYHILTNIQKQNCWFENRIFKIFFWRFIEIKQTIVGTTCLILRNTILRIVKWLAYSLTRVYIAQQQKLPNQVYSYILHFNKVKKTHSNADW